MTSKVSTFALALALTVWATSADAQQMARYPITGTAKYYIGGALPIPIPGALQAVEGAGVRQPTTGADPRPMQISAGQLTYPQNPFNVGVVGGNSAVFQVNTALSIQFPNQVATFSAGGRTGPATVSFCQGQSIATPCTAPNAGPGINGVMRYKATSNQFGGPARAATGGFADVGLRAAGTPPCDFNNSFCQVIFAFATPAGTGAQGAPFGVTISTSGGTPNPGLFNAIVAGNGVVTYITPTGLGPGLANPATSAGGPWTTGDLTVSVTAALGADEVFVMSGMDSRVNGIGTISLVTGSMSDRGVSGPNANRGWLQITVGETTPSLSSWGFAALALVLAAAATIKIRKSVVA